MREIKNIFSDRHFTRTLLFVIFLYVFKEFIFDHPQRTLLASHSNILLTILDMMNVPEEQRSHAYALSLFSESTDPAVDRFFFNGSLDLVDFPD